MVSKGGSNTNIGYLRVFYDNGNRVRGAVTAGIRSHHRYDAGTNREISRDRGIQGQRRRNKGLIRIAERRCRVVNGNIDGYITEASVITPGEVSSKVIGPSQKVGSSVSLVMVVGRFHTGAVLSSITIICTAVPVLPE